jgi:hypothetical protein
MPGWKEFARSVRGAWLLFRLDPRGAHEFDLSLDGFWKSFWAPALMLPLDVLATLLLMPENGATTMAAVNEALGFVLFFIVWPLLLIPICRAFRLTSNFVPYVVAYNWSTVVTMALMLPVALLLASEGGRGGVGAIALIGLLIVSFIYQFVIVRMVPAATIPVAAALVVLDYLLTIVLDRTVALLLG